MGRKKGTKVEVVHPNPPPQLPSKFVNLIKDSDLAIGKVVSDPIFVIQKELTDSDVSLSNNRFTIPLRQVVNNFLTETEQERLQLHKEKIPVMLVEPRCEINSVDLISRSMNSKKKKKKNKVEESAKKKNKDEGSAKECILYILTTRWSLVLKDEENKLKVGEIVGVWAVRVEEDLWLVLARLAEGERGEGNNSDDAADGRNDQLKLKRPPPPPPDFINFGSKKSR